MRGWWSITCFLLTLNCVIAEESISEILQTEQYALIAQQDVSTFSESKIPAGICPEVMVNQKNQTPLHFEYVKSHLVRDIRGIHPPMIMVIKKDGIFLSVRTFALNGSNAPVISTTRKVLEHTDTEMRLTRTIGMRSNRGKDLRNTLFDSATQMLYLDFSQNQLVDVEQYYVHNLFADPKLILIGRHQHLVPKLRYGWVEDAYSDKFYYKEQYEGEEMLFEISPDEFLSAVFHKKSGTIISNFPKEGHIQGISDGVFYVTNKTEHNGTFHMQTTLAFTKHKSLLSFSCSFSSNSDTFPTLNNIFLIRNYDFCLARDRNNYNKEKCDKEQYEYLVSIGEIVEKVDFTNWLLISCIVLFITVVILFVYIYWLRSTFISEADRAEQNEFETEASIFIAKQRSFPTSYQDPALLDVSVDKWQ